MGAAVMINRDGLCRMGVMGGGERAGATIADRACFCVFLLVFELFCMLLCIFVCFCIFLSVVLPILVCFGVFLYAFLACFCVFWYGLMFFCMFLFPRFFGTFSCFLKTDQVRGLAPGGRVAFLESSPKRVDALHGAAPFRVGFNCEPIRLYWSLATEER